MSPRFWETNTLGQKIDLMGPLGLNTSDKMLSKKIYLFAFGIGAGVVKSLAELFIQKKEVEEIVIMTGSRSEDEIIYKDYFDHLSKTNSKIKTSYVVSKPEENSPYLKGYIQDHVGLLNFNDSDVYVCGQESACNELVQKIKNNNPTNCHYFTEGFH